MDQSTTKNTNFTDLKYLYKSMERPFQGRFIYIIILYLDCGLWIFQIYRGGLF
jgi:hypothetical protein